MYQQTVMIYLTTISNSVIDSIPSIHQYVAYHGNNEPSVTTDSTGLNPSTDVSDPTNRNALSETNPSGDDVAIIKDESATALDQAFTIADGSGENALGIPHEDFHADLAAWDRMRNSNARPKFVIYHVHDKPFDIAVATEDDDSSWSDFYEALRNVGKGYVITTVHKAILGIVDLVAAPSMSEEDQEAYIEQGRQ